METITLWVALGAGLASFISPCVVPLVPVYIATLVGPEVLDSDIKKKRLPMFLHSLSFVVGLSIVFILLGVSAGLLGFAIGPHLGLLREISGSLLIALGIFMLVAIKVPWLNFEKRLSPSASRKTSYLRSFFTGSIFAVAWTPCVGPILAGVLALAVASETALNGAYLLAFYSIGMGVPFLIIGVTLDSVGGLLRRIYRHTTIIYIISGLLLIVVGILVLTNKITWFNTLWGA